MQPHFPEIENLENVPQIYKLTKAGYKDETGEKFLLYSPQSEGDPRCLIYAAEWALPELEAAPLWICDGTFRITPPDFSQVLDLLMKFHSEN